MIVKISAAHPVRPPGGWPLEESNGRLSRVVQSAQSVGPLLPVLQHSCARPVVVEADQLRHMQGARTGQLLIDALQGMPQGVTAIKPSRAGMPVRAVKL